MASTNNAAAAVDLLPNDDGNNNNNNRNNATATDYVAMEMAQQNEHSHHVHYDQENIEATHSSTPHVDESRDDNDDDDVSVMAESIASSVLTADGIHDFQGFLCVCLVILIGDMSRGIMFPSLWPLVEKLNGDKVFLGIAVSAFSFGRILVNPLFGSWSHQIGYSTTLTISTSILLCGTLVYGQIQNVGKLEFLIVAQTLLGIGSGTLGVTRAFVADVTAKRQRTTYMAWITAVQYAGFTVTPAFGALFNKFLGTETEYKFGLFRLNMYTAPAYFMAIIVLTTIIILRIYFLDRQRITTTTTTQANHPNQTTTNKKKSARRQYIDDYANMPVFASFACCNNFNIYDACIIGCMLLNVGTKGSIASFETLGIAIAQDCFQMASARAGIIIATCGALGVFALLQMGHLEKKYSDVQIITFGMAIMAIGIGSLTQISVGEDAEENAVVKNHPALYAISMFLIYSIGYPIGHTAVIGLFSKIVGRRPQGTLLGWFASAGSLARIIFPIMSGLIANYSTVPTLFAILTCVLLLAIFFVWRVHDTLTLLSS